MSHIENLKDKDPFAEVEDDPGEKANSKKQGDNNVHIRIQQRNGRKTLTTVQGIPEKFDPETILKFFKKKFACNGTLVDPPTKDDPREEDEKVLKKKVIQLQGDQRKHVYEFLTDKKEGLNIDGKLVKVHGF